MGHYGQAVGPHCRQSHSSLIPTLRITSATGPPSSACFSTDTICSTEKCVGLSRAKKAYCLMCSIGDIFRIAHRLAARPTNVVSVRP